MPKTHSRQVKPERTAPIELEVLATARVSPSFVRVTLGGAEIDRFTPRGYDQWFRLFLPPADAAEVRLPDRDGYLGYAQLLRTPKAVRPTMRNYTVREFRAATADRGAELDIDFVLHESPDTGALEGVAAAWAAGCRAGDRVGLLDEGYGFDASEAASWFLLVADETGLPAVAGICASLPADVTGAAIVEIPDAADAQEFPKPAGVVVHWVVRQHGDRPGAGAYAAASAVEVPGAVAAHAYAVGESGLATGIRRLLVTERGWAKGDVSFCGYWRLPKGAPAVDAAQLIGA
ncbi:NADPH-dependent ferric siderophore reductase [Agromyces terreus]|uniref:NADPH-dependent ferric siderophore reductase n=1 Tax=Agromyces terreus TaxID=424795 RepID=A0A9X2H0P0_9MICO|nr:siderophore-interacting protein [Agromyces terreus]MCP2370798.1 NADPH-dependent ferric siderophore reductase [Agromyces terreus]